MLAEARTKAEWYEAQPDTPPEARAFKVHLKARAALDAAVQERLDGAKRAEW